MNQFQNISPAICKVITADGSGTGFYLLQNNIWVTNYHVVAGNRFVALENHKLDRYLAKVIFINPEDDIAFLRSEYHLSESGILKSGKEKMYSGERFRCNDKERAVKRYESFLSTYKNFSTITLN